MPGLSSPFKTPQGEAEYRVACDATMRLWSVPYEPSRQGARTGRPACAPKAAQRDPERRHPSGRASKAFMR